MDHRSPRVVHHFRPVFLLQLFPAVAQPDLANGIGSTDPVIVQDCQFQGDFSQHAYKNQDGSGSGLNPLFQLTLLHHEHEGLVVVGVQVGILHRGLLFLANPLAFRVE